MHLFRGPARGSRFLAAQGRQLWYRRRGRALRRPEKTVAIPRHWGQAAVCLERSYFGFRLRKFFLEVGGLFANIQPIEKSIRRFQPNAEPIGDFDFLGALIWLDLGVARNHFGPAFTQARDV